jgi:hypothetical protein
LDERGTVLWVDIIHYTTPYILDGLDVFATEGQWYFRDSKANVNDLFKLAFDAGWSLRGIHAKRYMRIPPQVWRDGASPDKAQQQRRILTTLSVAEKKLFATIPKSRHGDVLDAIGIGRGALANLTTHDYDWPGKGYGT